MSLAAPYQEHYYIADGVTTSFSFGEYFTALASANVKCIIYFEDGTNCVPTFNVDMTTGFITIVTLTKPDGTVLTVPPAGSIVRVFRDTPEQQNVTASQLQNYTAKQLERIFDSVVAMIQEIQYMADHKTIRLTETQRDVSVEQLTEEKDQSVLYWDFDSRTIKATDYGQDEIVKSETVDRLVYIQGEGKIYFIPKGSITPISLGSVTIHNELGGRNAPDCHPESAITNLTTHLQELRDRDTAIEYKADQALSKAGEALTTANNADANATYAVGVVNTFDGRLTQAESNASEAKTTATNAKTAVDNHIANKSNPHEVTKAQIGLGNVDNTSDLDKPISTATQNALDLKANSADLAAVATSGSYTDLLDQPTIGNATLSIQKNSTTIDTFTANATSDKTINIVVPTQASDVNALPDSTKYGASLSLTINSSTYVITAQLKDQDNNNLGSAQTIDLPLESVVVSGSYDSDTKEVVLVLESGSEIRFSVADLVSGLQTEITNNNKLNADLVDDSTSTNKFVSASDKTNWDSKAAGTNRVNGAPLSNTSSVFYGTSDTAAATTEKEVSIPSITTLDTGTIIIVKPTITSTVANSTIKLNSFAAYPMRYNNAAITTSTDSVVWNQNYPSIFVFDGTYWVFAGHGLDSNTTYTLNYSVDAGQYTAGSGTYAITRYSILAQKADGTWEKITATNANYSTAKTKSVNTSGFILNQLRYYGTTTNVASGVKVATNVVYEKAASVDMRYSTNCGATTTWNIGDYIYLVGTIGADGLFYLDTTTWWSNALPATNDGKLYIRLGLSLTAAGYTMSFFEDRPIFYHDGTGIKEYKVADNKQDVISDLATIRSGASAGATAVQPSDLATVATSGNYNDLSNKPTIPTVNNPTITITQGGVTKGSFTLNQASGDTIALDAGGGGGAVDSVNGKTGVVVLTATDVGALPDSTVIPDAQIQSDWNQADNTKVDYIKNKPSIPTVNNATITITQGGVTKGSFTLNQASGDTIALDAGGGSVDIDNSTITKNGSNQLQAVATINANSAAGATNPIYDWVGTLAEYQAQNIETNHPDWICYITDDLTAQAYQAYTQSQCNNLFVQKGHQVIEFQAPNAGNNYTWYRKYADGWVEQGGAVENNSSASNTINLPVTMSDTHYTVVLGGKYDSNSAIAMFNSKTTNSFVVTCQNYNHTDAARDFDWEVKGMAA